MRGGEGAVGLGLLLLVVMASGGWGGTAKRLGYCSYVSPSAPAESGRHIRRGRCLVTSGASVDYAFSIIQWQDGRVTEIRGWEVLQRGKVPPKIWEKVTSVLGKVPYEAGIYLNRQTGNIVVVEDVGGDREAYRCIQEATKKGEGVGMAGIVTSADVCWIGKAAYSIDWGGKGIEDSRIRWRK